MAVPAWMMDQSLCEGHSLGTPQVSLASLNDVHRLIRALDAATPSEVEDARSPQSARTTCADDVARVGPRATSDSQ